MYIVLYLLSQANLALSLWNDPPAIRTNSPAATGVHLAPRPTDAPLQRRQSTMPGRIPYSICGWYPGGDYSDTYAPYSSFCLWNSDKKVVGDDRYTSCLGFYVATASLPSDFLTCSDSSNAYCVSYVYPSGYSGFGCTTSGGSYTQTMEVTWSGMDTAIAFPVYTGMNGASSGTQLPTGTTTKTAETSSNHSSSGSSTPVGAIVGGVIGGLAVVGIIVAIVVWLVIRRREIRKQEHGLDQSQGHGYEKSELSGSKGVTATSAPVAAVAANSTEMDSSQAKAKLLVSGEGAERLHSAHELGVTRMMPRMMPPELGATQMMPTELGDSRITNVHELEDSSMTPSPAFIAKIVEIDKAIAATDGLASGIDSVIQTDFDYLSDTWGSEEILVLDKAAISELLYKVLQDDQTAGFRSRDVVTHEGGKQKPPYVQLNSIGGTFRPYRIAKRQDGRLVLYGHAALYRAKRALERAKNPSITPSAADLIAELIDAGHAEGALLAPRGSELRERIRSIGSALNDAGGKKLMLQAHGAVRDRLGATCARELEVTWDGVGDWLG